ncbi:MAG: HAAS signaling domain-containing protein [Acutalibacteraceae bacterium]|jgi:hypothetical protein
MKEHYIKQVKKELLISRKQKNDVLRDLDEVFTSAMEHGETEQQVIERLGSPKDFAISTEEQLGIDRTALRKRNNIIFIIISIGVSVLAFVLFGTLYLKQLPDGVIGQADAMTNIRINGIGAIDPSLIFLVIGIAAIIVLVVRILKIMCNDRRK